MRTISGAVAAVLCVVAGARGADVADLVKQMKSRDADERRLAARELGEASGPGQVIVDALVKGLEDPDFFVRRFSAQSLGRRGKEAGSAVDALTAVARNKKERREVVEAAVIALSGMGAGAVPALADVVKDADLAPALRRRAAEGLGKIGRDARPAVPALTEALAAPRRRDSGEDIRVEVVTALGEIATPADEAALKALEDMMMQRIRDRTLSGALSQAVRKIKARK